jgi:hypothetical protein
VTRADPGWGQIARTTREVFDRLDWSALGEVYCDWGGETFWRERRAGVVTMGRDLGKRLLHRVGRGGASLWVGAGVGELPVLLGELLLHERRVVPTNLRARECELLNAALQAAAPELPMRYLAEDARTAAPAATFDHLGCVSVFTDPETWPVLADVAYGRIAPAQLDVERFAVERDAARELAAGLFARLARPGLITTTAEEVAWFLEPAAAVGAAIDAGEDLVPTAVVGDPVGFLAVR